jgi:hypothetical protein
VDEQTEAVSRQCNARRDDMKFARWDSGTWNTADLTRLTGLK